MKTLKNQKGFTLIELVLVIVVLGLLAAAAVVQFGTITADARAASLQGAAGPYSAQLAIAVNSIKGLPTGGATVGTCLPAPGTSSAFVDCVYNMVVHSGSGITRSTWAAANNNFALCTGTACGAPAGDLASNGVAPPALAAGCVAPNNYIVLDYQPATGAIFVSAVGNC